VKTHTHLQLNLTDGNETTRAVTQSGGGGVNLWIGGVLITADHALLFHELAKVAQLAAELQESVDERKNAPHKYEPAQAVVRALTSAGIALRDINCEVCGKRESDDVHDAKRRGDS